MVLSAWGTDRSYSRHQVMPSHVLVHEHVCWLDSERLFALLMRLLHSPLSHQLVRIPVVGIEII
jgi:hypothetical protein